MNVLACRPAAAIAVIVALLSSNASAQSIPERALIGYWHNWGGPAGLTLDMVPDDYDVINVSFAIPSPALGANMTFAPDPGLYPNPQDFLSDVQALQAQGKRVQISIGGGAHPVHVDTPAAAATFVATMASIINAWGFDGLDIDLEGSSLSLQPGDNDFTAPTSPRIVHFIAAMQQLLAQLPASFTLTAAPETAFVQGGAAAYGGVWGAYLPVLHALRNDLDVVHVQHYNSGTMFGRDGNIYTPGTADFHAAMADALIGGFTVSGGQAFPPLRPDQVAIGLPASTQAAGSGFTAAAAVHDALDLLYLGKSFGGGYALADPDGYLDFRGVMTWSINWDVVAGRAFSAPHRAYLDEVFLAADMPIFSTTTGGTVTFELRGGRGNAGRFQYLVPTSSGTSPGVGLLGGFVLPINPDNLTVFAYGPTGAPFFSGLAGPLDADGEATASMTLPAIPGLTATLHFAWFLPFPLTDFVSDAVSVTLAP